MGRREILTGANREHGEEKGKERIEQKATK
jgi:hypothetical protein